MQKVAVKLPIRGIIHSDGVKVDVKDVQKAPNGQNLHRVVVDRRNFKSECKSNSNR